MSDVSESAVRDALTRVIDPEIRRPITELDMVDAIQVTPDAISATIALTIVGCPASERIKADCEREISAVADGRAVSVELTVMDADRRQALIARLRGTKPTGTPFTKDSLTRVIAITSGKGGVGKSTITTNLAVDAAKSGLRVGVIDADVFGFSIPGLFGIPEAKPTRIDSMIVPPVAHDVKIISIGMFVDGNQAVSWRGPMLHRTINQFLTDVYFGDLDVLFLDLPPGTGDVAISVGQLLPHAEVIVVTTPQDAAADVAIRSAEVAKQTGQSILGVVETMSPATLPDGSTLELFGSGGGDTVASTLGVALLGQVPLSQTLRESGDQGTPVVNTHPDDPAAQAIARIGAEIRALKPSIAGASLPLSPR